MYPMHMNFPSTPDTLLSLKDALHSVETSDHVDSKYQKAGSNDFHFVDSSYSEISPTNMKSAQSQHFKLISIKEEEPSSADKEFKHNNKKVDLNVDPFYLKVLSDKLSESPGHSDSSPTSATKLVVPISFGTHVVSGNTENYQNPFSLTNSSRKQYKPKLNNIESKDSYSFGKPRYLNLQEEPEDKCSDSDQDPKSSKRKGMGGNISQFSVRESIKRYENSINEREPKEDSKNNLEDLQIIEKPGHQRRSSFQENSNRDQVRNDIPATNNMMSAPSPNIERNIGELSVLRNSNVDRYYEIEIKIFLSKIVGLFLAIIFSSLIYMFGAHDANTYLVIVLVVTVYLIQIILTDIIYKKDILQIAWLSSDDKFHTVDALCWNILIFMVDLRALNLLPNYTLAVIPLGLSLNLFAFFSEARCVFRLLGTLIRSFYFIQALLVLLQLDRFIDWSWELILLPAFLYFIAKSPYCVVSAVYLFRIILSLYFRQNNNHSSRSMEIIGFFWCFNYFALNLLAIGVLIGASQAFGSQNDFEILTLFTHVALWMSIYLLLFTFLAWKQIVKFSVTFNLIETHLHIFVPSEDPKLKKVVSFDSQKKENYFVMLSSTYFIPLQQSYHIYGKKSLNKIKTIMKRSKSQGTKAHAEEMNKADKVTAIEALKKCKSELDTKLSTINKASFQRKDSACKRCDASAVDINMNTQEIEEDIDFEIRNGFSADNRYEQQEEEDFEIGTGRSKFKDGNCVCYLCYTNVADAVLISCGHGGICYECAVALVNRKNECMECRKEVEGIYKIDPTPKLSNIIKSVELNKLVISTQKE